jgi:hypothetical protein
VETVPGVALSNVINTFVEVTAVKPSALATLTATASKQKTLTQKAKTRLNM